MYKKIKTILLGLIFPLILCLVTSYFVVIATREITVFSKKLSIQPFYKDPSSIVTTFDYRGLPIPFAKMDRDSYGQTVGSGRELYERDYLILFLIDVLIIAIILLFLFKKFFKKINRARVPGRIKFCFFYIISSLILGAFPAIFINQWTFQRLTYMRIFYLFWGFSFAITASNIGILFLKKWGRTLHLCLIWPYTVLPIAYLLLPCLGFTDISCTGVTDSFVFYIIALFLLIVAGCSSFYLMQPKVKKYFY